MSDIYPYEEAFILLCGKKPPYRGNPNDLNDDQFTELQEWALNNCKLSWTTGIGVIEAVITLVNTANEGGYDIILTSNE